MNSSHFRLLIAPLLATLLTLHGGAFAQNAAPADQDALSALDAARALERNETWWSKPLDLAEKDASLQTIAAHVQTALGEGAPRIEVRAATPTQSTFALKGAQLGPTLVSLAKIANCRVWVFDHFVIAPESALTTEERAALKAKNGGDWTQSSVVVLSSEGWSGRILKNRIALGIIGADIKSRLAAKGQPAPVAVASATKGWNKVAYELPLGELQPASQEVLQELMNEELERLKKTRDVGTLPVLTPSVVVGFDDTDTRWMSLFLCDAASKPLDIRWDVNVPNTK